MDLNSKGKKGAKSGLQNFCYLEPKRLKTGQKRLGARAGLPLPPHGCAWLPINEANQSLNEDKSVFIWYSAKVLP
jgi:hypothetical protein